MTITEFLLARIADDETSAQRGRSHPDPSTFARDNYGYLWVQPAHVLAECEAKRRLVELHHEEGAAGATYCSSCEDRDRHDGEPWPCPTIRVLASVYADHPDFDPAWSLS